MASTTLMNLPRDLIAKCNTPINTNSMPNKKESDELASTSIIKSTMEKRTNLDRSLANLDLHKTQSYVRIKNDQKGSIYSYLHPKAFEKKMKKTTPIKQTEQQALQQTNKKQLKKANTAENNTENNERSDIKKAANALAAPGANPYYQINGTTNLQSKL